MPSPVSDDAKSRRAERLRKALAIEFDGNLYEEKAAPRADAVSARASGSIGGGWAAWLCPCCPRRQLRAHAA